MGEDRWGVEGDFRMKASRSFKGLRPLGRHGKILIVAGLVYILIGVAYSSWDDNDPRTAALKILTRIAPIEFWGGLFIVSGLLAIVSSKWPPFSDAWGYMVLTGLSGGWSSTYLMGMLIAGAPSTNINGVFVWGLLGFLWWGISGLENPERTVVIADEGRSA